MFSIGDHLICIDGREPESGWLPLLPVFEGMQYVVRDAWEDVDAGPLIQLTGMPDNPEAKHGFRCGYDPMRFRKLEWLKEESKRAAALTKQLVSKGELKEITP